MLGFFAPVWALANTVSVPVTVVEGFVIGGFVAMFVVVVVEAVRSRRLLD